MDQLPRSYRQPRFVLQMRYPAKRSLYSLHFEAEDAGKAVAYATAFVGGTPAPVGTTAHLIGEGRQTAIPLRRSSGGSA